MSQQNAGTSQSKDPTAYLQDLLKQLSDTQKRGLQGHVSETPREDFSDVKHTTVEALEDSPNPGKITTYKDALRYIFKYMGNNDELRHGVRHCIEEQKKNEQDWWKSRQELVDSIGEPKKSLTRNQISGLRSVMTTSQLIKAASKGEKLGSDNDDEEYSFKEISALDLKIYRAAQAMVESQRRLLRSLNVPLFCILPTVQANLTTQKLYSLLLDQKKLLALLKDLYE